MTEIMPQSSMDPENAASMLDYFKLVTRKISGNGRASNVLSNLGRTYIEAILVDKAGVDLLGYADRSALNVIVANFKSHYQGIKPKDRTDEHRFYALATKSLEMRLKHADQLDTKAALEASNSPWNQVLGKIYELPEYNNVPPALLAQMFIPAGGRILKEIRQTIKDPLEQDRLFSVIATELATNGITQAAAKLSLDENNSGAKSHRADKLIEAALGGNLHVELSKRIQATVISSVLNEAVVEPVQHEADIVPLKKIVPEKPRSLKERLESLLRSITVEDIKDRLLPSKFVSAVRSKLEKIVSKNWKLRTIQAALAGVFIGGGLFGGSYQSSSLRLVSGDEGKHYLQETWIAFTGASKQALKNAVFNDPRPNISAAAALFDEKEGIEKIIVGGQLGYAMVTGGTGEAIMGDYAIDTAATDSQAVTTEDVSAGAEQVVNQPVPPEIVAEFDDIIGFKQARDFLRNLPLSYLVQETSTDPLTHIQTTKYVLPEEFLDKPGTVIIKKLLGQESGTLFNQQLPENTVAIVTDFPTNAVAGVGPFVMTQERSYSVLTYDGASSGDVYAQSNYPTSLAAEIWIQNSFKRDPIRPTDRWETFGLTGPEFSTGAIRTGALYVAVDSQGSWSLAEYPNVPATGNLVNLMFSFNQLNENGQRVLSVPKELMSEQAARAVQEGTADFLTDSAGPSPFFRYDPSTGNKDFITISPFLYLYSNQAFRELIFQTPFADGSLPNPDTVLVGAADLAFASREYVPGLLGEGVVDMDLPVNGRMADISSSLNHTGFYIGFNQP